MVKRMENNYFKWLQNMDINLYNPHGMYAKGKISTQSNVTLHSVILLLIYIELFFCDYVSVMRTKILSRIWKRYKYKTGDFKFKKSCDF